MSEMTYHPTSLTGRTILNGQEALAGRRRGLAGMLPFAGPAVIASIAYMDPGNFATNIQAGAKFGYLLLWVVLLANLTAMLFQSLSAKLGIVTGKSLAQLSRENFPRPLVWVMWVISEIGAMATDLAEFLGAAIGLSLLFGIPLMASLVVTGVLVYAMLMLQRGGFRPMEIVIGIFVGVIGLSYLAEMIIAPPDWKLFAYHTFVPGLAGPESVLLATGIIGATVMPHAIFLHSSLTAGRMPAATDAEKRKVLGYSNREVLVALAIAGMVNMAMVAMAARVFYPDHSDVAEIESAYQTLIPLLGVGAATVFMISLLASGFSSSVVGTMAGQSIMQDYVNFRIPLWLRRAITMAPAFVIAAIGINPTDALVISQVVLSLVLPVPMISLYVLSSRTDVMGNFVIRGPTKVLALIGTAVVVALNLLLLAITAGVPIPGLGPVSGNG
jgi:manganese transport protein